MGFLNFLTQSHNFFAGVGENPILSLVNVYDLSKDRRQDESHTDYVIFVAKECQSKVITSEDGACLPKFRKNGERSCVPGIGVTSWE